MKRLISLVLTLVMILGMAPAAAWFTADAAESADFTIVQDQPAEIIPADSGTKGKWYNNGSAYSTTEGAANYIEIVADGCDDAGALHVYQDNVTNNDMSIGLFLGGQAAGTYTLKLKVKGDLGLLGQTCKFYPYGCADQIQNLHDKLETTDIADWTEVSYEVNAASEFYYLIFSFSKYNWATNFYVDNIELLNSSGVNILGNAGNFYVQEEVTTNGDALGQWPDASLLDTSIVSSAYASHAGVWTPMYPTGAADEGTWNAWNDIHYGEIVADGYKNAGSMHLVSVAGSNTGIAIDAGMTAGETYTLGFYAKGTVNTGKVMGMYANGDGTIIGATSELKDGWNYYEHTFTATQTELNLVAADWGSVDIYLDHITLKGTDGVDLLAGCGDFYTTETKTYYTVMQENASEIIPSDNGTRYAWYNNSSTFVSTEGSANYAEIVDAGYQSTGALHIYQDNVANHDISLGMFLGGQPADTYTVKMYVKGDLGLSGQTCRFYIPGNDAQSPNLHAYLGTTDVADWTEVSYEVTVDSTFYYFIFSFSKYNWQTDFYVDSIQLINSSGVNILENGGNFSVLEEVTLACEDTNQWPDDTDLITDSAANAYGGTATDAWTVMYPAGTPSDGTNWTTWPAWDDSHYAEIVANGYKDAGSLHLVSCGGKNTGIAINAGMTAGETYTLGFYAKGTVNTGKVLGMYGNGDGTIISDTASFKAGWNYYELTFTAGMSQLNLVAADWGSVDIYLDNITLMDANGNDLLSGNGNFYRDTKEAPEEPEQPDVPDVPTEPEVEGLGVISDSLEQAFRWYWQTPYTQTDYSKVDISVYGANDPGSLHIWQSTTGSGDVVLSLVTTMASDLDSGSYTLSMNVKGTFCNTEGFFVYPAYCSDSQLADLNVGKKLLAVSGASVGENGMYTVDEWTNLTWTLPASPEDGENGFMYLALSFSKYNNTCEYFIDNIQVLDPNGNDVLGGAGSFMDSGSEYWPIILPASGGKIFNRNTMYYMAYVDSGNVTVANHVESGITAGDQNFSVTVDGTTISASSKKATVGVAPSKDGMPVVFSVTSNEGSIDIPASEWELIQRSDEFNFYDVSFTGAASGTEALTLGQLELGFVAGDVDGYSYTYTAAKKGTLTVAVESGDVRVILSTANASASGSLDVNAGETVTVQVVPTKSNVGYVATDAVLDASFAEYVCSHSYDAVVTAPTLSAQGYTTHTCSVCGDSYVDSYTAPLTNVEGWSLTLGGDLNVNFKLAVDASISNSAQIVVSVNGAEKIYDAAAVMGEDGYCYVSANVAAAQMNETITIQIVNGGDQSAAKEYTVLQYANAILADENMSEYHSLVKEMLNYGAAAQVYFNYDANNLVNAGIEGAGAAEVPEDADIELAIDGEAENISFYGASLVFVNKIAVRYYFAVSDDIANHSFTVNGESYEAVQKGDYYYIEVADINPQDLDDSITVIVDDALFVTYNPMNYVVRMAVKGSENLKALVKAMYNYHLAAEVLCPDVV